MFTCNFVSRISTYGINFSGIIWRRLAAGALGCGKGVPALLEYGWFEVGIYRLRWCHVIKTKESGTLRSTCSLQILEHQASPTDGMLSGAKRIGFFPYVKPKLNDPVQKKPTAACAGHSLRPIR